MTAQDRQIGRIVSATLTLIAKRGGAAVTMAAIAEQAGISRQTVYNHFPDVSAVVETALEMHGEAMAAELRARAEEAGTAEAKLAAVARFTIIASAGHAPLALETVLSAEARARVAHHNAMPRRVFNEVMATAHPEAPPDPVRLDLAWSIIEAGAATAGRHPDFVETIAAATLAALAAIITDHTNH